MKSRSTILTFPGFKYHNFLLDLKRQAPSSLNLQGEATNEMP
jgi:hypothetical protein